METSFDDLLKCKQCGALLYPNMAIDGVIDCEYCHTKYTVAVNASKEVGELLRMANNLLDDCKFDSAYDTFSKAASLDPKESEAYFGMALAEYSVQYLKDYRKKDDGQRFRLQPICHEISEKKFLENENYKKAIALATPSQLSEYQHKAEELEHIRNEFLRLKKSGLDYDCFICVKVTDDQTGRTNDCKIADDIYFALKGKGYKVFFSERELTNEVGVDYEAFVLYALYMSECMIVVCSREDYLDTPWVKNEYTRFICMINDEQKESGSIAIVFSGKPIEHLPNRAGKLQGINISSLGAMEQITGFVQKYYADNAGEQVKPEYEDEVEKYKAKLQAKQNIRRAKAQAKQDKWRVRQIELQAKREAKLEELRIKQTELDIKRTKQQSRHGSNDDILPEYTIKTAKKHIVRAHEPTHRTDSANRSTTSKIIETIAVVLIIVIGFVVGLSVGGGSSSGWIGFLIFFLGGAFVVSLGIYTIKKIWKDVCAGGILLILILLNFALAFVWGFLMTYLA